MTVDLMSPSTVSNVTSYMGTVTQENTESNIDATAIALTIFGMGIPVVTSLGSCLISFITYNPLGIKKQRIAEMIEDTRDEVRRFDAIISDYDAEPDFAEHLEEEDEAKYQEVKMMHKALVISHCDYVRERLKEHLGNPTSNNVLSEAACENILARLDKELGVLPITDGCIIRTATNIQLDDESILLYEVVRSTPHAMRKLANKINRYYKLINDVRYRQSNYYGYKSVLQLVICGESYEHCIKIDKYLRSRELISEKDSLLYTEDLFYVQQTLQNLYELDEDGQRTWYSLPARHSVRDMERSA